MTDTTGRYAPMPEARFTYQRQVPGSEPERVKAYEADQLLAFADSCCALRAAQPIDMILYCPNCGAQHVDKPEGQFYPGHTAEESAAVNKDHGLWDNPPHRSHLCHSCGCIWRPADVPTNGVENIKTKGKADTWHAHSGVNAQAAKRDPISAQAQALGIPFCCGKDERQADEIAKLRNVVQAAMFTGSPKVFEAWNYHFPDDKREVPQAAQRPADLNGLTATDVASQNIGDMSSKAAEKDAKCPRCNGSGTVTGTTSHLGPDDYDFEAACPACAGTGSANLKDAINALPYMEHRDSVPRNAHPYIVVERSKVLRLIDAALASRPVPPPTVTQESIFDELYEMGQHLTDALARIKELEDELSSMKRNNEMLLKHMDKLGAERDALKVDAERYRWLRDESREMPDGQRELYAVAHRLPLTEDSNESLFDGALDAAIDAAMKESGQ